MVFRVFGRIERIVYCGWVILPAVLAAALLMGCTVVESPVAETSTEAPTLTVHRNAADADEMENAESDIAAPTLTAPDDLATEPVAYLDCDFSDHAEHALDAVWQVKAGLSSGTAFHIGDGQWLTAEHVVSGNSAATLHNGGASIRATVVAVNKAGDTALLLTSSGPNRLEFGSLADIGPGHQAYAVGFPLYDAPQASISRGIVSRIERHAGLEDVILTDAAVNPGNSGGPLLNECGRVIGMNVSRLTEDDAVGLNYAIAEPTLRRRVAQLSGTTTDNPTAPTTQRAAPTTTTTPDSAALVDVPDVLGLSYGEADAQLRSIGLVPEPSYQVNTGQPENTVFAQRPQAGQRIEEGATVALTVSQGDIPRVPPVRGRNRVDATEILRSAGYEVNVIEGPSQAEAGIVVGQDPSSNTELAPGEAVTITVSTGPGQIFVPDVRGQTLSQAFQTLIGQGFRVGERREPSTVVEEGQIIDTDPPHGFPVSAGLEVFVIISDGPPLVAIPDVQGLLFDTGKLAIERAGLVIGIVTFEPVEPGSADVGRILAQTPPPNLEVSAETPVDVVVGESADA